MNKKINMLEIQAGVQNPAMREVGERRDKWSWLTEGIEKPGAADQIATRKRWLVEQMCENIDKWAYSLEGVTSMFGPFAKSMTEETLTTDISAYVTFAFPMVRRVFPRLLATELFTVQPMSQPTGKVFFFDVLYGTADSPTSVGDRVDDPAKFNKNYADSVEGGTVNEINVKLTSDVIEAEEKKLKGIVTIEMVQDLLSQFGMDGQAEVQAGMADEMIREIDRVLIDDAMANATAGNQNWNSSFGGTPTDYINLKAFDETIFDAILDVEYMVKAKRYKRPNWILAPLDIAKRLSKLRGFVKMDTSDVVSRIQTGGRNLIGTLENQYLIYEDPWLASGKALIGYKGQSWLDAGYVYAPYIPFWMTPPFTDPDTFKIKRGIMSRYGKKSVVGDMYGTLTITTS